MNDCPTSTMNIEFRSQYLSCDADCAQSRSSSAHLWRAQRRSRQTRVRRHRLEHIRSSYTMMNWRVWCLLLPFFFSSPCKIQLLKRIFYVENEPQWFTIDSRSVRAHRIFANNPTTMTNNSIEACFCKLYLVTLCLSSTNNKRGRVSKETKRERSTAERERGNWSLDFN